uniref:TBC1 domain family member 22A n=1 Tax=Cyprinodon variegatus TaxID=28743 RepID=A0A3Q2C6Z2_CYPVA
MSSDGNKKQFWKRNAAKVPGSIQHVYGAQHPPFDPLLHANLMKAGNKPPPTTPGKPKKATTFQEFESITSDAWDVGDDDDELLAMAAQNLNIEVVMETANKVIENHSKQQERQRLDDTAESGQVEEDAQEEEYLRVEEVDAISPDASFASQSSPYSESRLVKSHSEAPIGSPKGQYCLHRQRSLPHRPPVIPLVARMADQNTSGTPAMTEREASRLDKFKQLLAGPNTDLDELRKLSWSGIPRQVRPIAWKLLSGYLPANAERRESVLQRKRQEYFGFIQQYYDSRNDEHHQDTYRQIHIDIPRMSPENLVLQPKVTEVRCPGPRLQSAHDYFSRPVSSCRPASVWLPSDESVRLLYCSSAGVDGLKWWKRGLSHTQTHSGITETSHYAKTPICTPETTAAFHFRAPKPQSDFNQEHQSTNCCARSVSVTVCNGQICANLPVASCLSFSFFLSPQIHIDIPRTNPLIPLFQQASVQEVRPPAGAHTAPHIKRVFLFAFR